MLHCTLLYCKWQNELLSTCNTIETIRGTTWPLPRENPVKEMWQCPKLPNAKRQAHGTHEWTEAGIKTAKQLWQKILIYVTDNTDKIDLLKIYLYLRAVAIPVPTAYPIHPIHLMQQNLKNMFVKQQDNFIWKIYQFPTLPSSHYFWVLTTLELEQKWSLK